MGLIDLKTNLKDLKFGNDEYKGGSSGQPFVQTRIPATDEPLQTGVSNAGPALAGLGAGAAIGAIGGSILGSSGGGAIAGAAVGLGIGLLYSNLSGDPLRLPSAGTGGPDFLVRGGTLLPGIIVNDAIRLTKFFASTEGVLFTVKQNLLSRTAVRTQASTGLLNEEVYTPLSTLTEAGLVAFGGHVNKQGLNPFNGIGSLTTYNDKVNPELGEIFSIKSKNNNRLILLTDSKINNSTSVNPATGISESPIDILTYQGGPGSILGIGKTNIRFADQRTGTNNPLLVTNPLRFYGREKRLPLTEYLTLAGEYKPFEDSFDKNILRFLGASAFYEKELFDSKSQPTNKLTDQSLASVIKPDVTNTQNSQTGINNPLLKTNPSEFYGISHPTQTEYFNKGEYLQIPTGLPYDNLKRFLGLSTYDSIYKNELKSKEESNIIPSIISPNLENTTENLKNNNANNAFTYNQSDLNNIPTSPNTTTGESFFIGKFNSTSEVGDFRKLLRSKANKSPSQYQKQLALGLVPDSPNYTKKNIETRVGLGNPGDTKFKNLISYTNGKPGALLGAASETSYDKINWLPIYSSAGLGSNATFEDEKNDLVKFSISVIDTKQNITSHIHFRAFLNNISDTYNANWNSTKYIGRGEDFYNYTGFDRKVSLSWTVAAQSKAELIPMYKKLNFLASICTPNYSADGYMQGNIVKLTVGGYLYEQPGIITGLSYEMNDDNSSWEIGISDDDDTSVDESVKELPHLIKVNGFNFTPIHQFVPRLQQNTFDKDGVLTNYGKERYISLANGNGAQFNNYDS